MMAPRTPYLPPGARELIVEDEELVAMHLADLLQEWELEVVGPAYDVSDAQRLIGSSPPDAAILDVNLGQETSAPVARRLRELGRPFLLATASRREQLEATLRGAPIVPKPVSERMLRWELSALLAR